MNYYFKKDWIYINWKNYFYLSITNPKKSLNKIKGVFKSLKLYFRFAEEAWAPYPVLWVSKPSFIHIVSTDVSWKDKYDTPRFEHHSYVWIHIYKWNFVWYWELPLHEQDFIDEYWEQVLWYLYYYNTYSQGLLNSPNIEKAKENWPWVDTRTNKSTWNDKFLIK